MQQPVQNIGIAHVALIVAPLVQSFAYLQSQILGFFQEGLQ